MGMYTELIFGCSLKNDTPPKVIDILQALIEGDTEKLTDLPSHEFFQTERWQYLFTMSSYYFGVSESIRKMWLAGTTKQWWCISTRSNIKNYNSEISKFLDWIKPYIEYGSGAREMYAVVTYEEADPKIYYLKG